MNRFITLISHYVLVLGLMAQQDGTLDQSFADKGVFTKDLSNPAYSLRYQETYKVHKLRDGSILTFDFYSSIGGVFNCKITKFDKTGQVDVSFGENGICLLDEWINTSIGIIKIDEAVDGTLYILCCSSYNNYQLATLEKNGQKINWSKHLSPSPSAKTIRSIPYTGLALPSSHYLVATKDSIVKYDRTSTIVPNFHCNLKQVVGLFETPEPNKYLTFAIDNIQLVVRQILDNGTIDPDFKALTFDLGFQPETNVVSSGHFNLDFQYTQQLNDSIYAFVMTTGWPNKVKSFQVNLRSKTISTIKNLKEGNEYAFDKNGNIWVNICDTYYTSDKGLYIYKEDNKIDTLKINGGFFLAGDTLYTTNILQKSGFTYPVDPAPNKASLHKYINGSPDLSFGNQGKTTYRLSHDYDAPYQSIPLSDAYLINSISGGYYSYIYRLLENGTTAPVDIELGKLKQINLLKKSQLLQQGTDIFLVSDSMVYKYDLKIHTFKEYSPLILKGRIFSHTPDRFLIASPQGIRSIGIANGDTLSTFGNGGVVSLSIANVATFAPTDRILTHTTGAFKVFKQNGDILSFDSNGKTDNTFGMNGQLSNAGYLLFHSSAADLLAQLDNDSIVSFKILDHHGTTVSSSEKIQIGRKITLFNEYMREFESSGVTSHAVLQKDGKYVVAISINRNTYWDYSTSGGLYFTKLLRLNPDLSLDKSFGNEGFLELVGYAIQLQIDANKAYLFTNTADSQVMRKFTLSDNTVYKIHLGADALATDDLTYENTVKAFPNPTSGLVKFTAGMPTQDLAKIYNSIGVQVATLPLKDNTLDMSTFNKGMYLIKIGNETHMIIKE